VKLPQERKIKRSTKDPNDKQFENYFKVSVSYSHKKKIQGWNCSSSSREAA
jgi:hypothetical protein